MHRTVNLKKVRLLCAERGTTVTALCRSKEMSRNAFYQALRYPRKFPRTFQKILQIIVP